MPLAVKGLNKTLKALRQVSPDLYKETNAEIKVELKKLAYQGKARVPSQISGLSNFTDSGKIRKSRTGRERAFPTYDPQIVKSGIGYTTARQKALKNGWSARYALFNKSAAGAISEWAGRTSGAQGSKKSQSNNPRAGEHFIEALNNGIGELKSLNGQRGSTSRILIPVLKADEGQIKVTIINAINRACAKFETRI